MECLCESPDWLKKKQRFPDQGCRYYLQRSAHGEIVQAFPDGFRMVAGDPHVRNYTGSPEAQAISWLW
jgi:Domain of unknown function (DUF1996)